MIAGRRATGCLRETPASTPRKSRRIVTILPQDPDASANLLRWP